MSRRIEKINRTIKETISDVIQNRLSDPRLKGLISITRVDVSGDLTVAKVYVSTVGADDKQQELNLKAICHASGFIQSHLAHVLTTRTCPSLRFFQDDSLKKGSEVLRLIKEVQEASLPRTEDEEKQEAE